MAIIETETLLQEISPDAPSGEDLEYDTLFIELARAAQGKPEQQLGDATIPSEEPNWRDVKNMALELLGRSKDMRAAVFLVRALTHTDGLPGLNEGLGLLQELMNRYWDTLHPMLDPEDDNDPAIRVNTLLSLTDPDTMLRSIRTTPLVRSQALGQFNLRDVQLATGEITLPPDSDEQVSDALTIDAACMDCDIEELQATAAATNESIDRVNAIEAMMTEKVGTSQAVSLSGVVDVLREVQSVMNEQLEKRGIRVEGDAAGDAAATGTAQGAAGLSGVISNPGDVIRALDKIVDYYRRNEPSSPVPLLLQRAKRLVSKGFMEILQDVAPDGVSQAEIVTGSQSAYEAGAESE